MQSCFSYLHIQWIYQHTQDYENIILHWQKAEFSGAFTAHNPLLNNITARNSPGLYCPALRQNTEIYCSCYTHCAPLARPHIINDVNNGADYIDLWAHAQFVSIYFAPVFAPSRRWFSVWQIIHSIQKCEGTIQGAEAITETPFMTLD